MKKIPLTQGKFALIDDEDFEKISRFKWQAIKQKNGRWYAIHGTKYPQTGKTQHGKTVNIYMHRFIMNLEVGRRPLIDHINHNGLDNQKHNLRPCSSQQNGANRRSLKLSSSKYKGVSLRPDNHKWTANIRVNRKLIHIGCFVNEIEAAIEYDKKAKELFGSFACLNFNENIITAGHGCSIAVE